ncbi:hypothetical protein [Paracraurococcus lichenis]|uniref:Uncharacterized protein n=1 Tax=Paracraurococcus lichenis TaxID=3064888 RepID=A0ABT9E6X0_9PROT|nr:hypothetical protein [Paracraurococcus sp. LOR1-02]MDO9711886.1 hypothetical protein [Paracraurococcus sp. LOR1-02]
MGRKGEKLSRQSRADQGSHAADPAFWQPGIRTAVVACAGAVLLGIAAFGLTRQAPTASHAPSAIAQSSRPPAPPKPAFTRAEEAYIQALWPIHGDVQRSALRVSLGTIFYKTDEVGADELKARMDGALAAYRRAKGQIEALQAPPSLAREHGEYLAAVQLFERSTVEALQMFEDGDEAHLIAAHPLSREGGNKIREIGVRFWRDEFPAH